MELGGIKTQAVAQRLLSNLLQILQLICFYTIRLLDVCNQVYNLMICLVIQNAEIINSLEGSIIH